MTEKFIASTQYNDLVGTAAFDGHDAPALQELAALAGVPASYFPIGFELYLYEMQREAMIPFQLLAVRTDEVGGTADEVFAYAKSHRKIQGYTFEGKLSPQDFLRLFKRANVRVVLRELDPQKVVTSHGPRES